MTGPAPGSSAALIGRVAAGNRAALAQAISLAENDPAAAATLQEAMGERSAGAWRIGLTGPPGAGKSTLLSAVVPELLTRGHTVGVLLIDPSSPRSGGAVLADRVRLKSHADPRLYVRSVGSRAAHGGISAVTAAAMALMEHWGADVILVETVGAGQNDVEVSALADVTLLAIPPGLGDEMQVMKAGLMEMADVFVVTKSDREGASELAAGLAGAGPGGRNSQAREVLSTSSVEGSGIPELIDWLERRAVQTARPTTVRAPERTRSRSDPFDMTGQVAVITGATGGLGRRFAEVLHGAGAHVVLTGRRSERLAQITPTLPGSLGVPADITDPAGRAAVISGALERFGRVDVLINNAGVSGDPVPAEEMSPERWESTIGVNLTASFAMAQLAARPMLEQGHGSIVNITSTFGLVANAPVSDAAYAASKAALVNLSRELAVEWATRGVRVNAIAPGWFPSEMTAEMIDDPSSQRYIQRSCPMQRMGREDELDGALLFLASRASSYCTGQTFAIDGGWTAR